MNRILLSIAGLIFTLSPLQAQEFVAVKIEAENVVSKHADWRLTTRSNTPSAGPDPDGSHANSASGGAYMELLPDTRVTHGDPLISGRNFWNTAGTGPSMSYNVNIPEAGRYIVFAKAYSTGTEDNGIHVGLNNSNPASGHRMQWCAGKNKWTWSSAQRTNSNHCGTQRTIYLDFSFAGSNTVTFSAREDGFELDQFILLKTNNNSCAPNDNDQIVCNNGTTSIAAQSTGQTQTASTQTASNQANSTPATSTQTPAAETTVQTQSASQSTASTASNTTVVQTASQPANDQVDSSLPVCASSASDPDGDGYGWENEQSCTVASSAVANTSSGATDTSSVASESISSGAIPICQSASSDSDGDGYGWEQQRSCLVQGTAAAASTTTAPATVANPICESASSDSDGDGWGWENNRSCIVM